MHCFGECGDECNCRHRKDAAPEDSLLIAIIELNIDDGFYLITHG
jgi:hypothetical protein